MLLSFLSLETGCSIKSGDVNYDEVVKFSEGKQLKFPDFTLEYKGVRTQEAKFPNGNSLTFRYHDFNISSGNSAKTVSWSSGTGVIDSAPFEFEGKNYELEMVQSEKLNKKLDEDELVIVKK
jgi:hypothetical protein